MPPQMMSQGGGLPRMGRVVTALLIGNVAAYVLELILMRAGVPIAEYLFLRPSRVFEQGYLWQPVTYAVLHDPTAPGHLIFNMLALWWFGAPLEQWWGGRRMLIAYVICGLSGAAFTLAIAGLSLTPVLSWLVPTFADQAHVGASGATLGLTIAWGTLFAKQEMNFMFLGRMTGRTFVLIIIGFQLLVALSFDPTSSTSHFGGMLGGYLLVSGKWRPSRWRDGFRKSRLGVERRRIEHELRLIEGGKGKGGGKDDLPN